MIYTEIGSPRNKHQLIATLRITPYIHHFNWFQKIFNKHFGGPRATIPKIRIDADPLDDVIFDTSKLFFLKTGSETNNELINVEVESKGYKDIDIGINLDQLSDLNIIPEVHTKGIEKLLLFNLYWEDESGNQFDKIRDKVEVFCIPSELNSYKIEDFKRISDEQIYYKNGSIDDIFTFNIFNDCEISFSNPISGFLGIDAIYEDYDDNISKAFVFKNFDETTIPFTLKSKEKGPCVISLLHDKLKNPNSPRNIELKIKYYNIQKKLLKEKVKKLQLLPDPQLTELGVAFEVYSKRKVNLDNIYLNENKGYRSTEVIPIHCFVEEDDDKYDKTDLITLHLLNKAKSPEPPGEIEIKNFEYKFNLQIDNNNLDISNYVLDAINWERDFILINGSPTRTVKLRIDFKKFSQYLWKDDKFNTELLISFNYIANQPAKLPENHSHNVKLLYKFVLNRQSYKWLAIDFGTSAIATGLFDKRSEDGQVQLLNLNDIHTEYGNNDFLEQDSNNLLSSMMYLSYDSIEQDEHGQKIMNLRNDPIEFAPGGTIRRGPDFQNKIIPNLKTILGFDKIPKGNQDFLYKFSNKSQIERQLKLPDILYYAYLKLFRDYIIKAIEKKYFQGRKTLGEKELLSIFGNIIITVPNTFNQTHEKVLRNLLHKLTWQLLTENINGIEKLKNKNGSLFFKDKIKFVSESDAVVMYYIQNRSKLIKGSADFTNEKILVYDLGGGTLDLTYVNIRMNPDRKGHYIIEELGKFGVRLAGNVIDTILAKSLCVVSDRVNSQSNGNITDKVFSNSEIDKNFNSNHVGFFKEAIETYLKRELSNKWTKKDFNVSKGLIEYFDKSTLFSGRENLKNTVATNEFKEGTILKEFLKTITDGVFNKLNNIVDDKNKKEGKIIIDKVIVSGRASLFEPLEIRLQKSLLENTTIDKNDIIKIQDPDTLKECVVNGALFYSSADNFEFRPRDINAYYGIIWKEDNIENKYSSKIFLKPGMKPDLLDGYIKKDDLDDLFVIDLGNIDLSVADRIILLKSFSEEPETEYGKDRSDLFSKITEFYKVKLSGSVDKVPVSIKYNDQLKFRLFVQNHDTNYPIIDQDLTYEESTWPYNSMVKLRAEMKTLLAKQNKSINVGKKSNLKEDEPKTTESKDDLKSTLDLVSSKIQEEEQIKSENIKAEKKVEVSKEDEDEKWS